MSYIKIDMNGIVAKRSCDSDFLIRATRKLSPIFFNTVLRVLKITCFIGVKNLVPFNARANSPFTSFHAIILSSMEGKLC